MTVLALVLTVAVAYVCGSIDKELQYDELAQERAAERAMWNDDRG